jgi:hypothetical protein
MAIDQQAEAPSDTSSLFASVIQEHLELRRRNAALEHEMPLKRYMPDDPFENHPLFKTEEQARIEDTLDGVQTIVDEPSVEWSAAAEAAFPEEPVEPKVEEDEPSSSDEALWSRSRDFDWGD